MITQKKLKDLLHYDPLTGEFTWLYRDRSYFNSDRYHKVWNTKFCGKQAGFLVKHNNSSLTYTSIYILGKQYKSHRLAWLYVYGRLPNKQIDHINGIGTDNRMSNLREVSCSENNKNRGLSSRNTSGVHGVLWSDSIKKWCVHIGHERKNLYLGIYDNKFDAICARKSAENSYGFHENHGRVSSHDHS